MAFFHSDNAPQSRGFWASPVAASCGGSLVAQSASGDNLPARRCGQGACTAAEAASLAVFVSTSGIARLASPLRRACR